MRPHFGRRVSLHDIRKSVLIWRMIWGKGTGFLAAIANRPRLVLIIGWSNGAVFLLMSVLTHKWHWFPRGGAIMALCGFIVSVRESLLWRPYRPPETRLKSGRVAGTVTVRSGPFGVPVFPPGFGMRPVDPDLTQEDIDQQREAEEDAWENASEPEYEVVIDEGDKGRPMRDTADFPEDDLKRLRTSAVLGLLGTFIWAFGDWGACRSNSYRGWWPVLRATSAGRA